MERGSSKLRAACDACAASKVRCSKEQPVCSRCKALKTRCHHSASQKFGRPSRASKQPNEAQPLVRLAIAPLSPAVTTSTASTAYTPRSSDAAAGSEVFETSVLNTDVSFDVLADDWGAINPSTPSHWEHILGPCTTADGSDFAPSKSHSYNFAGGPSFSEFVRNSDQHPPAYVKRSCYSKTKVSLDRLRFDHESAGPMAIDEVLRNSRVALASLAQVLECPCSTDPTIILFIASTLVQILCGYRNIELPEPHASRSQRCVSLTGPVGVGSVTSSQDRASLRRVSITMGEFTLDKHAQEALSLQIVFTELKKLQSFTLQWIHRQDVRLSGQDCGLDCSGLHGMLGSWLEKNIANTLRDIQERLSKAIAIGSLP